MFRLSKKLIGVRKLLSVTSVFYILQDMIKIKANTFILPIQTPIQTSTQESPIQNSIEVVLNKIKSYKLEPGLYWDEDLNSTIQICKTGEIYVQQESLLQRIGTNIESNVILTVRMRVLRLVPWNNRYCHFHSFPSIHPKYPIVKATYVVINCSENNILYCCDHCTNNLCMI
jgi:hypothetical protein